MGSQKFYQGSDIPLILPLRYKDGCLVPADHVNTIEAHVLMNGCRKTCYKYPDEGIEWNNDGTFRLTIPAKDTSEFETGKLETEIHIDLIESDYFADGLKAIYRNNITQLLAASHSKDHD